jgi:hypothetical protein
MFCGLCVLLPGRYRDHVKPETLYNKSGACQLIGSRVQPQKERDHWEDQDVGGWTILKWILER